jgi:hypothetical protein
MNISFDKPISTKELDKIRTASTKMQKTLVQVTGLVAEIERLNAVVADLSHTALLARRAGSLQERKDVATFIRSQIESASASEMPLVDALEVLANYIDLGEYKDQKHDQG